MQIYFIRRAFDISLLYKHTLTPSNGISTLLKSLLRKKRVSSKVQKFIYDIRISTVSPRYIWERCISRAIYHGSSHEASLHSSSFLFQSTSICWLDYLGHQGNHVSMVKPCLYHMWSVYENRLRSTFYQMQ